MKSQRVASLIKTAEHPARTAVAAMAALLAARALGLPEVYWAPISTLIVVQAGLDTALSLAWKRLVGTALGAPGGALLSVWVGPGVLVLGVGVFGLGLICALLRLDKAAYRFAGITLIIVIWVSHGGPAWVVAIHRFCEVSVGIVVGVLVVAAHPGPATDAPPKG